MLSGPRPTLPNSIPNFLLLWRFALRAALCFADKLSVLFMLARLDSSSVEFNEPLVVVIGGALAVSDDAGGSVQEAKAVNTPFTHT